MCRAAIILSVLLYAKNVRAECLDIVSRKEWGGIQPLKVDYIIFPVPDVIVHHTVTPECLTEETCTSRVRNTQSYSINTLKFHDIAYNFLIGGDGRVYEGAGWHHLGAHTKGYNTRSIGIALIGNFEDKMPNTKQINALKDLLGCGVATNELDADYRLLAARQVRSTLSPGQLLYNELQTWKHFVKNPK